MFSTPDTLEYERVGRTYVVRKSVKTGSFGWWDMTSSLHPVKTRVTPGWLLLLRSNKCLIKINNMWCFEFLHSYPIINRSPFSQRKSSKILILDDVRISESLRTHTSVFPSDSLCNASTHVYRGPLLRLYCVGTRPFP